MVAVGTSTTSTTEVKQLQQNGQAVSGTGNKYNIGGRLATGDVNPTAEVVETYSTSETAPVQNNPVDNVNQTYYGYTVEQLRKYLMKSADDKTSFEELVKEAKTHLEEQLNMLTYCELTKEETELLNKIFPGENSVERAIIESYFNASSLSLALQQMIENKPIDSYNQTDLKQIFDKKINCHNEGDNGDNDPAINQLVSDLEKAARKFVERNFAVVLLHLQRD